MPLVRLVCWSEELAKQRVRALKIPGLKIDASPFHPSGMIGRLRDNPPAAILIDLDRSPYQGHGVAVAIRTSKSIRHIPIVFAGGPPEKVARIRRELPDAAYTSWDGVAAALKKAVRRPAINPVQPIPHMQRYAGTVLFQKLGIEAGMRIALLGAPDGFEEILGDLPEGVQFDERNTRDAGLVLWFVRSRLELERECEFIAARLPANISIWIIYPKQSGGFRADFNQMDVRAVGLAVGLVDYKICAVDADWSGMKFARKKAPQR